jgi:hypothetical protein
MTGFAGSRSLDERRRRRLATGSETVAIDAVAEPAPRRAAPAKIKTSRRGPAHFPLRKVISIRYWKLAAVVLGATLAGASILVGGWAAANYAEQLGPGFVLMFRPDAARLVREFAAVGFLLAGELALLIGWARSQSLQDFNGRYRGWVLCAVLAFVAALGLETQLAAAWSATAAWLWQTPFSHKATLCWLVPTAFCGLFAHAYLVREMRDCRVSLTFAWLAALLGCGTAAIVLARPLPLPLPQARLLECGVALLFVVCLFSSLLFHARHVVYVCVDPPAIRPARLMALLRWFRPGALFKFGRSKAKKSRKSGDRGTVSSLKRRTRKRPLRRKAGPPETETSADGADSPTPPSERPRVSPPLESRITRVDTPSRRVPTPVSASQLGKTAAAATRPATRPAAVDDGDGASSGGKTFEGMSRREKRMLKKQIRDERAPLRRSA